MDEIIFNPKMDENSQMDEKQKNKKTLVSLYLSRTYTLGSDFFFKMKNKKGGLDWTSSTLFIPSLPQTLQTSQLAKPGKFKGRFG
jgi:hypothetical protein